MFGNIVTFRVRKFTTHLPTIAKWLRKNQFSTSRVQQFSKQRTQNKPEMTGITFANGLLLYYYHYSFYSQKVVLALHEKNLTFDSHIINISKGEQYQPWFLELNPKGEIPVLQDNGKIIPDSARIIDYLEDNFSNGDTPRLFPLDQGAEVKQKITHFRTIIDKVPGNVVTVGSFLHPELVSEPKLPFIGPVRTALADAERKSSETLKKYAELNPGAREMLLEKAKAQEIKHQTVADKTEFLKVLDEVEDVLSKVEEELASHDNKDWWLCSDRFTVADVSLAILLERLNQVGLEERFWTGGKKPNVENYYSRLRQRESFQKTIPNKLFFLKTIFNEQAPLIISVSIAVVVAIVIGGVFLYRRTLPK